MILTALQELSHPQERHLPKEQFHQALLQQELIRTQDHKPQQQLLLLLYQVLQLQL